MKASILPPGTLPHKASLNAGAITVKILKLVPDGGEKFYAHCEYPDGFVREHQVKDIEELVPKVVSFLRGRYGVESVTTTKAPAIKNGAVIEMEI